MSNEVVINVRVDADKSGFSEMRRAAKSEGRGAGKDFGDGLKDELDKVGSSASSAAAGLGQLAVGSAILGWAPAAAAALAQLAGAALVLPAAMGAAAAVVGTLGMALSGIGDAISAQGTGGGLAKGGAAAAAMARQIRDAVDNINDARQAAARVAEESARRVEDAERNAARVARDGAESIAAAKQRVAEAAQQSAEQVQAAQRSLADTEQQVARQIADAERNLARAVEDAARQVAAAKQAQARTIRDTARTVADAQRAQERTAQQGAQAQERAAETVAKALKREQEAQEDLSKAREEAAKDIEDLRRKVSGYAVDEAGAALKVREAEENLRKVNASRRYSELEKEQAAQDVAEAEQHLADVQANRAQDTAKLAQADQQGIDSTDKVQNALEKVQTAHDAVADAQQAQARTAQDVADANTQAAQRVADAEQRAAEQRADAAARVADAEQSGSERIQAAQQSLVDAKTDGARRIQDAEAAVAKAVEDGAQRQADARAALTKTERDAAEANVAAQRSVDDAKRESAQANADAAQRVADAEQHLADVEAQQREQMAASAGAANSYAAALAKLSPEAQQFVEAIRQLRPEWEALQQSVQDAAFQGLAETVQALAGTYFPVLQAGLTGIATQLNGMAQYAASALMSPEAVQAVNDVLQFTGQFLDNAKTALGDFLLGFLGLMEVGASYLPQFGSWLADIAQKFRDWIDTKAGRDEIRQWIEDAFTAFGQLWTVLQNVWAAVSAVGSALGGGEGGKGLLQYLVELSEKLKAVAQRQDTQILLQKIGEIARKICDIMIEWGPQILAVGLALGGISLACKILGPVIEGIRLTILGVKLAIEAWRLAQLGLNLALSMNPIGLVVIAIGALALALAYAWTHSETFRNVVTGAFKAVWDYIQRFVSWAGTALSNVWNGISNGVKNAVNGAIRGLNWLIDVANGAIRAINALPGPDLPLFGKFGYLAHGGIAGGMAVVGEQGPELVKLPQGSQVYPAGQSRGMADKLGGQQGGPSRIELVVGGNTDSAFATALMKMIRTGQIQIRQSQLVAG